MGQHASRHEGDEVTWFLSRDVSFQYMEELGEWTLPALRGAHARLLDAKNNPAPPVSAHSYVLSKWEFWEVFNDYTVIREDGTFLGLPLELYRVFDRRGRMQAFYPEIATLVALCCSGDLGERLEFVFDLFDMDGDGYLSEAEMMILMRAVTNALQRVGLARDRLPDEILDQLSRETFANADASRDGLVSRAEFGAWAAFNVESKALLDRMNAGVVKLQQAALLAEGAGHRVQRGANAVATRTMLRTLATKTRLTFDELHALRERFQVLGRGQPELSKPQFTRALTGKFPQLAADGVVDAAFRVFDRNRNRRVSFKEFSVGLSRVLRGSLDAKLGFIFALYDRNGDGRVALAELVALVHAERAELVETFAFVDEIMDALDTNGDGTISRIEFSNALRSQVLLRDLLAHNVQAAPGVGRILDECERAVPEFDLAALARLWMDGDGRFRTASLGRDDFIAKVSEAFAVPAEAVPLLDRLFHAFDVETSGSVAFREVLAAISRRLLAQDEVRNADFFFRLYDADDSGSIEKDELVRIIVSLRHRFSEADQQTLDLLAAFPTDADNTVTRAAFRAALLEHEQLMDTFGRIFGIV